MPLSTDQEALTQLYRAYNARCNAHRFDQLGEFVHEDVEVNGQWQGLEAYSTGLSEVVRAFPDYRWEIQHLLINAPWIAAHFRDTGTHRDTFLGFPGTGRAVETQEFAFYRIEDDKIVEVWVTADNLRLLDQLKP